MPKHAGPAPRFPNARLLGLTILLGAAGCNAGGAAAGGHHRIDVPGEAMRPTIRSGQTVEARPVPSGKYSPRRGDIVAFVAADWSGGSRPDVKYIKRVIAIGGDTIRCCSVDGKVVLNGTALAEPYLAKPGADAPFRSVTVPTGRLWVMGDNRLNSYDSRTHMADPGGGTIAATAVTDVVIPPR